MAFYVLSSSGAMLFRMSGVTYALTVPTLQEASLMRLQRLFSGMLVLGLLLPVSAIALPHSIPVMKDHAALSIFSRKTITLNFRNDSGEVVELRAGEKVMTLEPGKTATLRLPLGSQVCLNKATSKHAVGYVVANADSYLDQTTIALH